MLTYGKGENIQTNLKEFTEQLALIAGDAFNCVRLGEYFTYEDEPYRNTVTHYAHQLDELDDKINKTESATEIRALRDRKALITARHEAKDVAAIASEDAGRMEEFKMEAWRRFQKIDKLDEDKKKLFFTICRNMSEVSIQKVKEHLTVPVWLELELNTQDPLILWNAIKATHMIVKQDNDKLTLFAVEAAYNNIKMRPDELPISYFNRIIQAIDMVKSRNLDVETDRNYTEDARVLRMVKGLDPARFGELQLTFDQNEKMGLDTIPKTMLEALELINEFKVKAPSSMQKPGGPFKAVFAASVVTKRASKKMSEKKTSGKPGQPSEVPTKEASFRGKCFKCDQEGHRAKECPNAEAVKEIIDDRAQDRRNVLALTSQSPGPGTARKSIFMIRLVQASRKERETIAHATPSRIRDKRAGVATNIGDVILAVIYINKNQRINKGFNFNEY
jgi:hypothetical protein